MAEQSPISIVNAYVDRRGQLVLLRREGDDLQVATRRADFVSYHRLVDITPDRRRQLERDDGLAGWEKDGEWARMRWKDYAARKLVLADDGLFARIGLPHYEADVHPVRRYLVDSGARIQKPRRAFLDIETDSRLSFARLRAGQGRVLCWSVVDEQARAYSSVLQHDSDAAEKVLLEELVDVLDDFDQIVAWNGDGFDFLVLKGDSRPTSRTTGRLRHLGVQVDTRRWLWLDHLALYKRMNLQTAESGDEKQSFKLQDIAMSELGEGKDHFDSSRTWDAWLCTDASASHSRDALVRYNIKDTDLLRRIEEKTGFCALLDTICDACGGLPDSRGMRPLNQLDPFMLRLGKERGMHFPTVTRFEQEDDRKKFAGAYVMEPKFPPGIQRNVHVCDFKSLYPSIIISWNMSPETKVLDSRGSSGELPANCSRAPGTGVMFRTDVTGLLPMAVDRLLKMRSRFKKLKKDLPPGTPEWHDADRKSNAYKVTSNAFFGGTGNEFSRFFDVDVAESITQAGVYLDHAIEDALRDEKWFIGYADTDSSMVSGDPNRKVFADCVQHVLNGRVIPRVMEEFGCVDRRVDISYEKQFDRIFFTGKKRYAATYIHYEGSEAKPDSRPEIKGLEFKRGDTNKIARRLQERVIRMILGNWDPNCLDCGKTCTHGPKDEAPKGSRTAWLWSCPACGPRQDGEIRFAVPVEDPEVFRVSLVKARDYVLTAKLPAEFVRVSKAIQQPLADYVQKPKADGTPAAQPPHVQVAKLLEARGEEVSVGTKVDYVVIDGADAIKAIPASDYVGECDRFYLWEKLVWPPIERVLLAALPGTPWDRLFGKVRPAKEKPPLRGGAAPGQMGLFGNHVPLAAAGRPAAAPTPPTTAALASSPEPTPTASVPTMPAMPAPRPYVIRMPHEVATRERLLALKEICDRHPGRRPVHLVIGGTVECFGDAEVQIFSDCRVKGSDDLGKLVEAWMKGGS